MSRGSFSSSYTMLAKGRGEGGEKEEKRERGRGKKENVQTTLQLRHLFPSIAVGVETTRRGGGKEETTRGNATLALSLLLYNSHSTEGGRKRGRGKRQLPDWARRASSTFHTQRPPMEKGRKGGGRENSEVE